MDLKHYDSGRICEALGWLYGDTWALNGTMPLCYTDSTGSRGMCFDHMCWPVWFLDHARDFDAPIEAELRHALEVTEPWNWDGRYAKLPAGNGKIGRAHV